MDWIIRLLPRCQMAARVAAIRRLDGQAVIAVDMAQGALHVGMAICQKKAGGIVVPGGSPTRSGVATGAL